MSYFRVAVFFVFCLFSSALVAVDITSTDIAQSDRESAQHWGISVQQYRKYKSYMDKEGKYFYEHLDPVFVSGLIADTPQEREVFAKLFYQQELKRAAQLIAFNDVYRRVGKAARGDNPIVSTEKLSRTYGRDISQWRPPTIKPQTGDRITYFVNKDCGQPCAARFKYYLSAIGDKYPVGTSIDVYFIDFDRKEIENWASDVNLNPGAVKAGTVTLNFDDRYKKVFGSPSLPAAFLVRNNQVLGQL